MRKWKQVLKNSAFLFLAATCPVFETSSENKYLKISEIGTKLLCCGQSCTLSIFTCTQYSRFCHYFERLFQAVYMIKEKEYSTSRALWRHLLPFQTALMFLPWWTLIVTLLQILQTLLVCLKLINLTMCHKKAWGHVWQSAVRTFIEAQIPTAPYTLVEKAPKIGVKLAYPTS